MKISIVLGTQWGDEGKGRTVSCLCLINKHLNNLVIRFNGGHQAGHTVHFNNIKHVFSSFGSGTLQNVPTYWSKYCTVYPIGLINEYLSLKEKEINPKIYIDELCPITTPYDFTANRNNVQTIEHGTCGVGFGETVKRHESMYKLYFMDIFNDFIFNSKMEKIKDYYGSPTIEEKFLFAFNKAIEIIKNEGIGLFDICKSSINHLIFEGAQGILLDKDFGIFPNVTFSNSTSKNVMELLQNPNNDILFQNYDLPIDIYYVARTYQTRHGNGFMSNEKSLNLIDNGTESNIFNNYQKHFRTGEYDQSLIDYAIQCNELVTNIRHNKNLVLTCSDQYQLPNLELLKNKFDNIYISNGAETEKIISFYNNSNIL
jgi:adenylosuccinate synthase